jgi:hypothetical protein
MQILQVWLLTIFKKKNCRTAAYAADIAAGIIIDDIEAIIAASVVCW